MSRWFGRIKNYGERKRERERATWGPRSQRRRRLIGFEDSGVLHREISRSSSVKNDGDGLCQAPPENLRYARQDFFLRGDIER